MNNQPTDKGVRGMLIKHSIACFNCAIDKKDLTTHCDSCVTKVIADIMAMLPDWKELHLEFKKIANFKCMDCKHEGMACVTCSIIAGLLAKYITAKTKQRLEGNQ